MYSIINILIHNFILISYRNIHIVAIQIQLFAQVQHLAQQVQLQQHHQVMVTLLAVVQQIIVMEVP